MNNRKKRFKRNGRVADIAKLDFHDFHGRLIDRNRGKTTEKDKGLMMINKLEDRFNINDIDMEMFRKQQKDKEAEDFEEMLLHAEQQEKVAPKIKWTRDSRGNIISPFDKVYNKEK